MTTVGCRQRDIHISRCYHILKQIFFLMSKTDIILGVIFFFTLNSESRISLYFFLCLKFDSLNLKQIFLCRNIYTLNIDYWILSKLFAPKACSTLLILLHLIEKQTQRFFRMTTEREKGRKTKRIENLTILTSFTSYCILWALYQFISNYT